MADERTTSQIIYDRKGEMQPLFDRMDKDKDLYYLAEYKMKQLDGQYMPTDRVHNVTLNDPALFAWRANAILSSAHQQIVVESNTMNEKDCRYIEQFLEAVLYEVDVLIGNLGKTGLYPFVVEQADVRGRVCARVTFYIKKVNGKDVLVPLVTPWDTRFVTYRNNLDGHVWIAYETERSVEDIKREYPKYELQGDTNIITDYWTSKKNEVLLNDVSKENRNHKYGEVPVIYQIVPAGSQLADSDAISHEGESIFALDRGIWPELNKSASVLQTLNMMTFLTPLQYESEAGELAELPDRPPYGVGTVVAVEKGGGFKNMPVEDIRNATRHLLAMLEGRAQRGALPAVDYGNLTFPLSAVAIAKLTESKDQIFVPRLQAISMFYQKLCRMMIRQYCSKGMAMEFGEEGQRQRYDPANLKGDYTIKFQYYSQSPEQVIANYTVGAAAYESGVSQETIFTDIIKFTDPIGEIIKRRAEDAAKVDPVLMMYDQVHALIDRKKYTQAKLMANTVVRMIRQRRQAMSQQEDVTAGGNGQRRIDKARGLLPLLNQGSGAGGMRRAASDQLEASEEMMRDEENRQQMAETNRTRREAERV
jgi:hypothetical protein